MTTWNTYTALTEADAVTYCRQLGLFAAEDTLQATEIGDGNLNLVFRVESRQSGRSVIIKQALPYARVVGSAMPLTLERSRIEAEALKIQGQLCQEWVPAVYHYDPVLAATVMEDLKGFEVLRKGLMRATIYPRFARGIAHFLAMTLFWTSDFGLAPSKKKEMVGKFLNPELCKITEDLVFTEPYYDHSNNHYDAEIEQTVQRLRADRVLLGEVFQLKYKFMTEAQALVHGDLHTGSIMVRADATKVIDPEFAFYGPMGFDIGAVVANLLLSYCAHQRRAQDAAFLQWIRTAIRELWTTFTQTFRRLYEEAGSGAFPHFPYLLDTFLQQLLQDATGFAGCKMIRRVIGLAHVADLDSLPAEEKHQAEVLALQVGQRLIRARSMVERVDDVLALLDTCTLTVE
ncbi:methylthioribose kinase [Alicyclobacillus contaminans]|uniref:S-methyl-5-thioribose kinase n=1 Tax=Alicyclobacillus contaminans TaxID=392016 RepID=UPI00041B0DFE|nr:S-methyl-5-thioribose kinase [Alicyclobacillus contaminans]GMA50648.1 methylthioribose kinase [Alicyclobacillus contaminans]